MAANFAALLAACKMPAPQLSDYDGSTSIDLFIAELDAVHQDLDQDDRKLIRLLRHSLKGHAKDFFFQHLIADNKL